MGPAARSRTLDGVGFNRDVRLPLQVESCLFEAEILLLLLDRFSGMTPLDHAGSATELSVDFMSKV